MKNVLMKDFVSKEKEILENVIENEEPIVVKTDDGNVVILSEQQFDGMIEAMCRK